MPDHTPPTNVTHLFIAQPTPGAEDPVAPRRFSADEIQARIGAWAKDFNLPSYLKPRDILKYLRTDPSASADQWGLEIEVLLNGVPGLRGAAEAELQRRQQLLDTTKDARLAVDTSATNAAEAAGGPARTDDAPLGARKDDLPKVDVLSAFRDDHPPLDFVLPGLLRGTVGMLAAPGGAGKSMFALQAAMSIALGADTFGLFGDDPTQGRALILAAEDPQEVIVRRIKAIGNQVREAVPDLVDDLEQRVAEHLTISPLYGLGFEFAVRNHRDEIAATDWVNRIERLVEAASPRLIVLDTVNRSIGNLDENSNGDMAGFLSVAEQLSQKLRCSILMLHHMNKFSLREGAADQASSRGASALVDNCRWAAVMMTMSERDAKARGYDDEQRRRWVRIDFPKVNYSAPLPPRWACRLDGGVLVGADPAEPDENPDGIVERRRANRRGAWNVD